MPSRRALVLLGTLLVLLLGYGYIAVRQPQLLGGHPGAPNDAAPLAGPNSVSALEVKQNSEGAWIADFDYFYTGAPRFPGIRIKVLPTPRAEVFGSVTNDTVVHRVERGAHHASVELNHPLGEGTTRQVVVTMGSALPNGPVFASTQIDKVIDWPRFETYVADRQFAKTSPKQSFDTAVTLIDSEGEPQLIEAKRILEKLISQNAQFDAGYVELARIAMKSNWGVEGLHQAENLLSSALQIRPDNADAKILLGYVYSHQKRYAKAEELFADAAKSNPRNLWLWVNWGEVYALQGKTDAAMAKYREAVSRPMTHDTYDRARADAYTKLLKMLEERKDFDGMETLYKQRIAEFGPGSCYSSDYARFLLQQRGDTQGAIDLAHRALGQDCEDSAAREVLGLAEYMKWAETPGPERIESLNQARIFLPSGPRPLYLLSTSERTVPAAKQLIASGEQIDQRDNEKLTALAYALKNQDLPAAQRLLTLGARPDAPVGFQNLPVALMPVIEGNVESTRLMRRFGADYSKLRYRGVTAFEIARQSGNTAMLAALGHQGTAL